MLRCRRIPPSLVCDRKWRHIARRRADRTRSTHAKSAVELDPANPQYVNNLGVAYYRSGDCKAAIAALERSMELRKGGYADGWFFLAMSHWQLGNRDEARRCYDQAIRKMTERATSEEMNRIRAEAAELLGVNEKAQHNPSTAPATTQPKPLKN